MVILPFTIQIFEYRKKTLLDLPCIDCIHTMYAFVESLCIPDNLFYVKKGLANVCE